MSIEAEIKDLAATFPPHPLESARAFREWGGTYLGAEQFEHDVRGRTWTELAPAFLEYHHDALVFFGPSSIPDYLPAYLTSLLRQDPGLSAMPQFLFGILRRGTDSERFEARFAQLTSAQREAVARSLAAFEAMVAGTSRQQDATDVLDSYWRSLIAAKGE